MSTEVEQPTVAVSAIEKPADEINGAPVASTTETTTIITVQNGDSKTAEKNNGTAKKEPEVPKDPKTETAEWLKQQHKQAIQKANFDLLKSAVNQAYEPEDPSKPTLPASGFVTQKQFIGYLKDGVILARVANKFKPGSVETVKEGEDAKVKENQKSNVDGFVTFAKEYVPEEQLFNYEDLEKGKESFVKVFVALFQLMLKAPEHFQRDGIDFDQFIKDLGEVAPKNFKQQVLDKFGSLGNYISSLVRRPFARSNNNAAEQNGTATNGVHTNGTTTTEPAHEENGVQNGTKVEEKKEEAPVVVAT